MSEAIAQFAGAKYLNLETFRKTGVSVRTPVWFAQESGAPDAPDVGGLGWKPGRALFYVYSEADAGKVKRIRNNPKVRIAPCTFRGEVRGAWFDARARLCSGDEAAHGQQLLRRKYGWQKIVGDFFSRNLLRHHQAVVAIEVV